MTELEAFCARLRTIRRQRGLTQADVAEAVGVTAVAVGCWERGRSRPMDVHLEDWAAVLGVPVPAGVEGVPTPQCGTRAGYKRHRRRGEPTCEPCRRANTADWHRRNGAPIGGAS